ncbi:phenylalanine--tRNA ligase subunit beta [Pseudalkalibacillus caeni]|uniref:Phenylalanine--tRNA ligase beta subunit n=1 Tax=Exobacillus caeni TaxID=2574798 RepID=A0A5R9F9H9_9BACL|nr:phenylalanine--tRNA ligase subunit beta [Pseudalkalibacillus caeni]TLS39169.1 phenylalanine--tRNA ligase subunit beta [Pseudalkalibacillus caeni]
MLVSMRWLEQYVDLGNHTAEQLADLITKSGIEVETVESLNKGVKGVVVGHVVSCEQHPNADKLNLCKVDIGEEEPVQIICGAPNVAEGQKVAVAKVGAVLPGNFKIKKAKLRGEASNGMICSLQELGIESKLVQKEFADGIFVFPNDVEVGTDALEYLNLNDKVLELGLTPNRADCMNMLGVAYEVAAILKKEVNLPSPSVEHSDESAADYVSVSIENKEDNPYYGATIIKGVEVKASPLWLVNRLVSSGIRPINNIVDITNYVLLEYGQPLHAFDYDRLGSKEIVVRRAGDGEKIETLDDTERTLSSDHLVITNGKKPVAVAGVMGGADSEVYDGTQTILLEAAYFNGFVVRQASKDLNLRSDSSARFEKGIDRNRVHLAAKRAASLIVELAGGEVLEGPVEAGERTVEEKSVSVSVKRINRVLGTDISENTVAEIFDRLRFEYNNDNGTFSVLVPARRPDITIEEDLIEEVGRLYGYDNLPATFPYGEGTPGGLTDYQNKRRLVRRYMEGAGLYQVTTYSLTSPKKNAFFGEIGYNDITLSMPMSEERAVLRTSLVPHLLDVIEHNHNRQLDDVAIYETAKVFLTKQEKVSELPKEEEHISAAFTGLWQEHSWQKEKKPVDFFVAKGVIEGLVEELGLSDRISFQKAEKQNMHPGRTANVLLDEEEIGFVGQLHPEAQSEYDINETYLFELNLERLLTTNTEPLEYKSLPRFPSVTRDIALVVDEGTEAQAVLNIIEQAGGKLLAETRIFDLYQGEHMEEGKKSLAFSLRYYNPEHTLTEEEVKKAHDRVVDQLKQEIGASLRG